MSVERGRNDGKEVGVEKEVNGRKESEGEEEKVEREAERDQVECRMRGE